MIKDDDMQLEGNLISVSNNQIIVKLKNTADWQIDELVKSSDVELTVNDNKTITIEQRKKAFAMIHDISEFTGYTLRETEEMMKIRYISNLDNPKFFSLSDCRRDTATDFIEFMINFCLEQSIPFTTKVFDEIQQSYALRCQLVMHRLCFVCGKPNADLDHVDTIGSGRNRRHVNQVGYNAWTLCRNHHTERHKIGVETFAKKYQVKPIKLNAEMINKLNLADKGAVEDESIYS